MKIMDAFNEVAPQLLVYARKGLCHAVITPVEGADGHKVLCAAFARESYAKAETKALREAGYKPIRLDLKDAKEPRDCLKAYYVPPTRCFGSFYD